MLQGRHQHLKNERGRGGEKICDVTTETLGFKIKELVTRQNGYTVKIIVFHPKYSGIWSICDVSSLLCRQRISLMLLESVYLNEINNLFSRLNGKTLVPFWHNPYHYQTFEIHQA